VLTTSVRLIWLPFRPTSRARVSSTACGTRSMLMFFECNRKRDQSKSAQLYLCISLTVALHVQALAKYPLRVQITGIYTIGTKLWRIRAQCVHHATEQLTPTKTVHMQKARKDINVRQTSRLHATPRQRSVDLVTISKQTKVQKERQMYA